MIYEVEIDDSNETGKQALKLLKELHINIQAIPNLLPEQKLLIEQSLREIEEGKFLNHDEAMKAAKEWLMEK